MNKTGFNVEMFEEQMNNLFHSLIVIERKQVKEKKKKKSE
jgi:hypothetical protein